MKETKFKSEGNQLIVSRSFDAPIELVWHAWTKAELLDQWWAPKPWQSITKSMEFKEGGSRLYAMRGPEGEEHWGLTNYKLIKKHSEFSGEDAFCDHEGIVNETLPVAKFQNQFLKHGNVTIVTVVTQYDSEEHLKQVIQMGMKEGLEIAYNNLDVLIEQLKS